MIHVIEVLPRKLFKSKSTTGSKPDNRLRNHEESEKDKNENMLREKLKDEEQELKRRMKEEYEHSHTERVKFELKEDNSSDSKPLNWLLNAY
ncbi:hypothetical protein K1T71_015217 [Dendrolimus kikuchii]|nr:hypothetical protein K1T71_015217 [Dendrolimus kikuchii]